MGEDQHAAGVRRLDEAQRGDRLAGAGGVLEPEALGRVGVLGLLAELRLLARRTRRASPAAPRPRAPRRRHPRPGPRRRRLVVGHLIERIVVVLVLVSSSSSSLAFVGSSAGASVEISARSSSSSLELLELLQLGTAAWPLPLADALDLGHQRGQRPRERVDLVGGEHGPVDEVRLLLGEDALQPEQQRELAPPLHRRGLVPGVDLEDGSVERPAPRGAGGERLLERFAVIDETLAGQPLSARDRVRTRKGGG